MIDAGRKRYAELLESIAHVPLYANTWWLDATSGEHGWKVLSWKNLNSDDETFMPYQAARIRGLNAVVTPPLTQFLPVLPAAHKEQFCIIPQILPSPLNFLIRQNRSGTPPKD